MSAFLGHKEVRNTEIYITIEETMFQQLSNEFTVRVASTPEEIKSLLEAGFDYVCEKDGCPTSERENNGLTKLRGVRSA
jgi:hypothetical protein